MPNSDWSAIPSTSRIGCNQWYRSLDGRCCCPFCLVIFLRRLATRAGRHYGSYASYTDFVVVVVCNSCCTKYSPGSGANIQNQILAAHSSHSVGSDTPAPTLDFIPSSLVDYTTYDHKQGCTQPDRLATSCKKTDSKFHFSWRTDEYGPCCWAFTKVVSGRQT